MLTGSESNDVSGLIRSIRRGRLAAMGDTIITLDDPKIAVRLRVNTRARRFTLRLEPSGAGAVLTLPPGVPKTEARMFLLRQSDWLVNAVSRNPGCVMVADGARIPVAGEEVEIRTIEGPRRAPRLEDGGLILYGHELTDTQVGPRVAAFLKTRARDVVVPAARRYAAMLDRQPTAVSLRDTRSRWGSCTAHGRLSFCWRLAMAPPEVLNYVAAHEAAHLIEMNHGPGFWKLVEQIMPGHNDHRAWLKREGRKLHAFQFAPVKSQSERNL